MQIVLWFTLLIARPVTALETDLSVQEFEKDAKNRPVSKVIALLKDMVKQLEKEGEDDEEVYETMGCWCVTNEKAKTKSIADAQTSIETLTASIESLTARSAKLNTEIGNLEAEIKSNTEALETATAVREKELAEFTQEEKDSLVTINQLKAAVIAVSAAHDAALLKKKSKVGKVDASTLDSSESNEKKLDPSFVKEIEAEALRAHMHRIITTHPAEVAAAFMQVNHKAFDYHDHRVIASFIQGATNQPGYRHHGNFASKIRDFALNIAAD